MALENQVTFAEVGNPKRVTQLTENTDAAGAYFLTEKVGESAAKKTSYATVESAVKSKVQSEYLQALSASPVSDKTMSEKLVVGELKKRDDQIVQLKNDFIKDDISKVIDRTSPNYGETTADKNLNVYMHIQNAIEAEDVISNYTGVALMCDNLGNVVDVIYSHDNNSPEVMDKSLSELFSKPVNVTNTDGTYHYAFPGATTDNNGTLHAVYRRGISHLERGSIVYSYSKDNGTTWSDVYVVLPFTEENGWVLDYRDSKMILMANGKFLITGFFSYHKMDDSSIRDDSRTRCYTIVAGVGSNGAIDFDNKIYTVIENFGKMASGGGLTINNREIYWGIYDIKTNNGDQTAKLAKSKDGITWDIVSDIGVGTETSMCVTNDELVVIVRDAYMTESNKNFNAAITRSKDFTTFSAYEDLGEIWQGHHSLSFGDQIIVAGRHTRGTLFSIMNKGGVTSYSTSIPSKGDSGYAQISFNEHYMFIVYYASFFGNEHLKGGDLFCTRVRKSDLLIYLLHN